jgi:hypothetical protein
MPHFGARPTLETPHGLRSRCREPVMPPSLPFRSVSSRMPVPLVHVMIAGAPAMSIPSYSAERADRRH